MEIFRLVPRSPYEDQEDCWWVRSEVAYCGYFCAYKFLGAAIAQSGKMSASYERYEGSNAAVGHRWTRNNCFNIKAGVSDKSLPNFNFVFALFENREHKTDTLIWRATMRQSKCAPI